MTESWEKWEGRVIDGKFPLRRYLGSADGNAVFLTEHGDREPRKAAIKLIPANSADTGSRLAQWELARKLSHPHLLRLFDSGRHQGSDVPLLYVVTEFAEENLGQILPQRALTPAEAREMLQPVLEALAYLHGDGLVHGGLKPANIMAVDDQLRLSCDRIRPVGASSGRRGGKNVYLAPESANGEASQAADIWALGATLVEALTQRPPVLKGSGDPVLPNSLPEPFLDIARHCLVRDPHRRWTAGAIAAWLRPDTSVQQKKAPVQQASASPHERLGKSRYKIFGVAAGIAAVLFLGAKIFRHPVETPPASVNTAQPSQVQPTPQPPTPKNNQKAQDASHSAASLPPAAPEAVKTPTSGRVPGSVVEQVLPAVAKSAQATIQGHIKVGVRVAVDGSGSVTGTKLVTPGPSKYFARLSTEAARRWKFKPAEADGQGVASEWVLRFEFSRKGTTVHPTPAVH
jgi:TonB family protein